MVDNSPTLGFLLHDVARLLRKRLEQNARESGLTRSQWQVLAYLAQNEGINQSGLADLLDVEPITLGRLVDKLQALRLIERRPHPTVRRVWTRRLTAAAHLKVSEARKIGQRPKPLAFTRRAFRQRGGSGEIAHGRRLRGAARHGENLVGYGLR